MSESEDSPLSFPCDFPVKAMGAADDGFAELVTRLVGRHAAVPAANAATITPSRNGNYHSVTVTIQATSRRQLDAIYQELQDEPQVLATL